jgi:hypothetical protein
MGSVNGWILPVLKVLVNCDLLQFVMQISGQKMVKRVANTVAYPSLWTYTKYDCNCRLSRQFLEN